VLERKAWDTIRSWEILFEYIFVLRLFPIALTITDEKEDKEKKGGQKVQNK